MTRENLGFIGLQKEAEKQGYYLIKVNDNLNLGRKYELGSGNGKEYHKNLYQVAFSLGLVEYDPIKLYDIK